MVAVAPSIRCLRDPTRGGLATTLNELARQSGVGMKLQESAIPIKPEVKAACELLGLDPIYVANEGKLICICPPPDAQKLIATMHANPHGKEASIIGEVIEDANHMVQMETIFGGSRVVDWLVGEQLPRIC
jgi:hydrogenase expression/formation protein HypE